LVADLAARQAGVVAAGQLYELGLTYRHVQALAAQGHLHRLHRGVYSVGHTHLTASGRLTAAQLACGQSAFISHRSAAAFRELMPHPNAVEVTVVGGRAARHPGLTVHRTRSVHNHDVERRGCLWVSTVPRLLIELASTEPHDELVRMITLAIRRRKLSHGKMEEAIVRHAHRAGLANLKRAYGAYRSRPDRQSKLERDFDKLLDRHPEIPQPNRNVHFGRWELDCYWPEQKVALELDGRPYHLTVGDIEKDRYKDAKLLAAGIRPLRATGDRFGRDPEGVLNDLKQVLGIAA
jgi:very-short-patch-repair endonuclease